MRNLGITITASLLRRSLSTTCGKSISSRAEVPEQSKWLPVDPSFATTAIHAGYSPQDDKHGLLVPSISVSSIAEQEAPGVNKGYSYIRYGNPSRTVLEKTLAALDKGKHAFAVSSGVAAIFNTMSMLQQGDHAILTENIFSETAEIFQKYGGKFGITTSLIDMASGTSELERTLKPNTKLVWLETPSNPTLKLIDIAKTCEVIRSYNKDIIVVVDSTLLSPYYMRPLTLGADLVLHSLTKFVGGHSDVLMGCLITNREDIREKLYHIQKDAGAVPSPFDCFLVHRSLKTLHVRMPLHMSNAMSLAKFLEADPRVDRVLHPGLPSHPQHALALKQSAGHSGLFSFYLKDNRSLEFMKRLNVVKLTPSLGGVESIASTPYDMSHWQIAPEIKKKMGITENLIRVSIGLESIDDLIQDMDQALNY